MGLCFATFVFLTFRGPLASHDSNPHPNRSRIARYNAWSSFPWFFGKRQGKLPKKQGSFVLAEPQNPWERREKRSKSKEFFAKAKGKEFPKRKERKIRGLWTKLKKIRTYSHLIFSNLVVCHAYFLQNVCLKKILRAVVGRREKTPTAKTRFSMTGPY